MATNKKIKLSNELLEKLPPSIEKNPNVPLAPIPDEFQDKKFVQTILKELNPAQNLFSKVENRSMALENPDKKKSKPQIQKKVPMNSIEKRKLKIYEIPKNCHESFPDLITLKHRFSLYLPLHQMWLEYMESLLGRNPPNSNHLTKIPKADFHGCLIMVTKSKCASYIGICGIVIKETKNVFNIITRKNELKVVPKLNNIFSFKFKETCFNLYGNQIIFNSAERSAKKFKAKPTIDL